MSISRHTKVSILFILTALVSFYFSDLSISTIDTSSLINKFLFSIVDLKFNNYTVHNVNINLLWNLINNSNINHLFTCLNLLQSFITPFGPVFVHVPLYFSNCGAGAYVSLGSLSRVDIINNNI